MLLRHELEWHLDHNLRRSLLLLLSLVSQALVRLIDHEVYTFHCLIVFFDQAFHLEIVGIILWLNHSICFDQF